MSKSDNVKQKTRQFLQGLKLRRGRVRDWIWRKVEGRIPCGAICFALQTKLMLRTLADVAKTKTLLAGMTVPVDRLPNWRHCWTSRHYFWKTIYQGAGQVAVCDGELQKGEERALWDSALFYRRMGCKKPVRDEEQIAKAQKFAAGFMLENENEILTESKEMIRALCNDLMEPEPEYKLDASTVDWNLVDAVRFLFQVWFQCQLKYQVSPWQLFAKAKSGDMTALERLLALDHQVGSMPELNDVVHQRLMRKHTESQIAIVEFDITTPHLMVLGAIWIKDAAEQFRDFTRLIFPKSRPAKLTYEDSYDLLGGHPEGFQAFRRMLTRLSGTFPTEVWDILKPQVVPL
ncbi:MAG: hypothetical protein R3C18_00125 [Planctomycetaceae bacterium]